MNNMLPFLVIAAMVATVGALMLGVVGMFWQGPFYRAHSNKIMQARVLFQSIALLLFALLMLLS